jgi:lipopolysaccharide biosynthesis glycosyltransferase
MATTMQSIMENADQKREYIFFVLHREITDDNIDLLKKQIILFPQFSIKFINVSNRIDKYNMFLSRHLTIEAYFRLLIPELLSEYQKAIWLDGDMICCCNIAELFDVDLKGYFLAAVRDGAISWYNSKKAVDSFKFCYELFLQLKKPEEYFNSGMLVFNIKLFCETTPTDKLLELAASHKWQLHDQDVLNYMAEGKTLLLPYHWNFVFDWYEKYLPEYLQKEYISAKKNPKIIHFIHFKPWNHEEYFPHFELFWKYATHTPFIDIITERMKLRELMNNKSFKERVIANIIHRKGIGLRFILIDCLKAWLLRNKSLQNI